MAMPRGRQYHSTAHLIARLNPGWVASLLSKGIESTIDSALGRRGEAPDLEGVDRLEPPYRRTLSRHASLMPSAQCIRAFAERPPGIIDPSLVLAIEEVVAG